ncbi:MAG TPA: agmatine deiminase, partial [Chromatiales bacterium]|nr:agmatine deiminase [Chromatiales bacterium]
MPQSGVLLVWPHEDTDWRADLPAVEAVYLELARAIAPREKLLVVCKDATHQRHVSASLQRENIDPRAVRYAIHSCNDSWARDIGPLTVLENGAARLLDFRFNGWGGKFPAEQDNALSASLVAQGTFGEVPAEHIDLVLEGGSIDTDGEGTLLTTRACLLHPTR